MQVICQFPRAVCPHPRIHTGSGGLLQLTATHRRSDRRCSAAQAICVRSVEGRRRIISEVVATLAVAHLPPGALNTAHLELILQAPPGQPAGTSGPYEQRPGYPAPAKVRHLQPGAPPEKPLLLLRF
jgi:hypothetical protein